MSDRLQCPNCLWDGHAGEAEIVTAASPNGRLTEERILQCPDCGGRRLEWR